jgi:formate hydrogenlyase transcriptional activator
MSYDLRPLTRRSFAGTNSAPPPQNGDSDRSRLLLEINNAVVNQLDLEELLAVIFSRIKEVFKQTTAATLSIFDSESNQLRVHLLHSPQPETFLEGMPIELEGTPSGLAVNSRQIVLIHEVTYEEFPSSLVERALADGVRSGCSVPLISHQQVLGTITLGADHERGFSEADAELLGQVAEQIAMPVENALNFRRAKRQRDRARLVLEAGNLIVANLDLNDLLLSTSACLRKYFKQDFFALSLYDEEIGQLRLHTLDVFPDDAPEEGIPLDMVGTPAGQAFTTRKTLVIKRLDPTEFSSPAVKIAYAKGIRSGCSIPLISRDRALGVLALGSNREAAFTPDDVELLQHIANEVAIAVENMLNFRQANRERDRFELLLEINNAVVSNLDLGALVKTVSASLRDVMPHDAAGIALYEPEHNHLREYTNVFYTDLNAFQEGDTIPLEGTPAGKVFRTGQPLLIKRPNREEYPEDRYSQLTGEDSPKSACLAALVAHGRKLGIVGVSSTQEERFTEKDLELFCQLAGQIALAVENSLQYREIESLKNKLASEKHYLEEELKTGFGEIVGQSRALKEVLRQVETVAPTDSVVLICGETGTGKELIARAIHDLSARRERTLVKLNCAAIPTGLLESELFGHEKGAFTGAVTQRTGRFELANKGSLFLDEVGEIPPELQPKLLRVLQEQEFERLGSSRTIRVDARLIAATNCDLKQMVADKKFRSDLYYRLNVFPIVVPPLRERLEDIPLLASYFAQKHSARMNKHIETIPSDTIKGLTKYHWPGNVRELENFIERSVILSQGSTLHAPLAELQTTATISGDGASIQNKSALTTMDNMERSHIEEVLRHTNGSIGGKGGAAEILGLPASTLRGRMKKLGIR